MSQWLTQVIANASATPDFLAPVRQQALSTLQQNGWPGRRSESWRFTPLTSVEQREVKHATDIAIQQASDIAGLEAYELVFVDGKLTTDCSALSLPEGVTIAPFDNNEYVTASFTSDSDLTVVQTSKSLMFNFAGEYAFLRTT